MQKITNPSFYTGKIADLPEGGLRNNQVFIDEETGRYYTKLSTGMTSATNGTAKTVSGVTTYIAQLTQAGTADPTASVLLNDTGLSFTWVRNAVGSYSVTLTGDYARRLLIALPSQNMNQSASIPRIFNYSIEDVFSKDGNTILNIYTTIENGGTAGLFEEGDSQMVDAYIKVEVLPS